MRSDQAFGHFLLIGGRCDPRITCENSKMRSAHIEQELIGLVVERAERIRRLVTMSGANLHTPPWKGETRLVDCCGVGCEQTIVPSRTKTKCHL